MTVFALGFFFGLVLLLLLLVPLLPLPLPLLDVVLLLAVAAAFVFEAALDTMVVVSQYNNNMTNDEMMVLVPAVARSAATHGSGRR